MRTFNYTNLEYNITNIRNYNSKNIIAVVKNNAYNCGLDNVLKELINNQVDIVMVTYYNDAIYIKDNYPSLDVLISNPLNSDDLRLIKDKNFHLVVDSYQYLVKNIDLLINHHLHVKINTSMNRFGVNNLEELKLITEFAGNNNLYIVGLFTHMSLEDEDEEMFDSHVELFKSCYDYLNSYFDLRYIHSENSYTYLRKDSRLDFCNYSRIGLLLYGYNSSDFKINLKPLLTVTSKVVKIRKLNSGDTFSYGLDNKVGEETTIAICDIGYGNGLLRSRSKLPVIINNNKYEIIGKISMSHFYVKVDEDVKVGDIVNVYDEHDITPLEHAKVDEVPTSMILSYLN